MTRIHDYTERRREKTSPLRKRQRTVNKKRRREKGVHGSNSALSRTQRTTYSFALESTHSLTAVRFQEANLDSATACMRACRFGSVTASGSSRLFCVARTMQAKKPQAAVVSFDTATGQLLASRTCGPNGLCALATSPDGRFVAVGDLEGFVTVFNSADLQVRVSGFAGLWSGDVGYDLWHVQ